MREQFLVNAERRRYASNSDDGDSGCAMGEYTWVPPGLKSAELIHKYYSRIPEGKIPYVDTIGERYRVHQLLLQLPPHDSDPRYCQNLTEAEKREFQLFITVRKEKASGRGTVVHIANRDEGAAINCVKCAQPIINDSIAVLCHRLLSASSVKRPDTLCNTSLHASGKIVDNAMTASVRPTLRVAENMPGRSKWQLSNKSSSPDGCDIIPNAVDSQAVFRSGEDISGRGGIFHPECFVCNKCSELLIDLTYFFHNGALFCGRHYCEQIRPRCTACDEIIFADECTEADGRSWHVHHFLCSQCERNLGGDKYILRDGHPYCCTCFDNLFAELCETCSDPIGVDEGQMAHDGQHWHSTPECFCCQICKCSLLGKPFLPKYGNIFCSIDCAKCFSSNGVTSDCKKTGAGCDHCGRSKCLKEMTELVSSEKDDVHDRKCPFSSVYSTTTPIKSNDKVISVNCQLDSPCDEKCAFSKPNRNLTVTFDDEVVVNHIVINNNTISTNLESQPGSRSDKECVVLRRSHMNGRGDEDEETSALYTASSALDKCVQCDFNAVDAPHSHSRYCPPNNGISDANSHFLNEEVPCATGNGCVSSKVLMEVEAAELAQQQPIDTVCCESATVGEHVEGDSYLKPRLNGPKLQMENENDVKGESNELYPKCEYECSFTSADPYNNNTMFKQGVHKYGSIHRPIKVGSTSFEFPSDRKERNNGSKYIVDVQTLKSTDNNCRVLTGEPVYDSSSSERRVSHSFDNNTATPGGTNEIVPTCAHNEGMLTSGRTDKPNTEPPVALYSSIFDTGSCLPDGQNRAAASKLRNVTDTRVASALRCPRDMETKAAAVSQRRKASATHTKGIGHLLTDAGIDRLFYQKQNEPKVDRCVDCSCYARHNQLVNPRLPGNWANVLPAPITCDHCKPGPETSHFADNDMTQSPASCKNCPNYKGHNVRALRRALSSTAFDPYRGDGEQIAASACTNKRSNNGLGHVSNLVSGNYRGEQPSYLCQQLDKQPRCLVKVGIFRCDEECGIREPTDSGNKFDELCEPRKTSTVRTGCMNPYNGIERPRNVPVLCNAQHYYIRNNCTSSASHFTDGQRFNQCTARCCKQIDEYSSDGEEGEDSIDSAWDVPCPAFKNCKHPNKQVDQSESTAASRPTRPVIHQKLDPIQSRKKHVDSKKPSKSRQNKNDVSAEEFPLMNVKIRENFDVNNYRAANNQQQSRTPPIMHVPKVEVCSDWTANYCPPPSLPTNQLVNTGNTQCRYSTSLSSKSARAGSDTCINHGVRIIYYEDDMSMCSGLAQQSDGTRFESVNKLKGIEDYKQARNGMSLKKHAGRSLLPAGLASRTKGPVSSSRKTIQRCDTTSGRDKLDMSCLEADKRDYQPEENIYETALNKPISSGKSARSAVSKMNDHLPSNIKKTQSQQSQHHCTIS